MTQNSLSPGYIVLHSSTVFGSEVHTHKNIFPVQIAGVATPGVEPSFFDRDGSDFLMSSLLDDWIALYRVLFNTGTTFTHAEYWDKPTPTSDPIYVFTYVMGVAGSSGTAPVEAGQVTVSFRSLFGGILKMVLLESVLPVTTVDVYPFSNTGLTNLTDYMIGGTGWIQARDGGSLVIPYQAIGKLNDALRRKFILG